MVAAVAVVSARVATSSHGPVASVCQASVGTRSYSLDLEQAANATTIAAVGKRLGLPDHAVTVALAAALQESGLHNLAYGDMDSLGLFQQRPSQGWGTYSQIMVPTYAATAFYRHLAVVTGWQAMAVTDAAQAVQRSAAPAAYAAQEAEARVLAQVVTGEVAAGLLCRFPRQPAGPLTAAMTQAMTDELGSATIGVAVPAAQGWTVSAWLVGHAQQFRIPSVAYNGQRWVPTRGTWIPDGRAGPGVAITSS